MKKFILLAVVAFCSGFSGLLQAALINVASIEIASATSKSSGKLYISEITATELGTGVDLASLDQGATATGPTGGKWKDKKEGTLSDPSFVLDDLVNKKQGYYFAKSKKGGSVLTINLAQVSDIDSIFIDGKFAKKKEFLSLTFLDAQGNAIYRIDNMKKVLGKKQKTAFILPNRSGVNPPVSNVPLPNAFWLFASGLIGLVGIKRQRDTI